MKSETVNSVSRAMAILLLLYEKGREMSVTELGLELNMHKSTTFRILNSMEQKGVVWQNPETKKYWLGIKIFAMGELVGEKMSWKDFIQPYAEELHKLSNETVNVSVLDTCENDFHKSIVVLKESGFNRIMDINQPIGSSNYCYCSGVGKCLLAYRSQEELNAVYRNKTMTRFTEHTIIDGNIFLEELKKVRSQGYAMDREEREVGLLCVAAPIFNRNKEAFAAISIAGAAARLKNELEERTRQVCHMAALISSKLN